jgi:ferritin
MIQDVGKDSSAPAADAKSLPWTLDDIPLDDIDFARIRGREDMMFLLAAASFIEFASDTYAGNLAEFFRDDPDIAHWLSQHWEPEEVQHGRALRAYVQRVWPQFDWDVAYRDFFVEYSKLCGSEGYESTRGLEMAARCVVETGTSTAYRAIRDFADEPVLVGLAEHIRSDEVRHYKHFLKFFDHYDAHEKNSRFRVLQSLKNRLVESSRSDVMIGLWYAFHTCYPDEQRNGKRYAAMQSHIARMVRAHYPAGQAIRMLLKPLRLPAFVSSMIQPMLLPLGLVIRQVLLR